MVRSSLNLPAEFIVRQAAARDLPAGFDVGQDSQNLPARFDVGQDSQNLPAEFVVAQWMEDLPTRLRTMRVYDLRGTAGVGFYWQGAANPPESMVDFIIESPTGFWVGKFPDGSARLRQVFFPWHEFKKTGIDGTSPDMSRIDGFIWIVHTDGLRRIDHLYAVPFGNLHGIFDVQQRVIPPAFAYIDLVGDIWLQEFGGYHDRGPGAVALFVDDPYVWGGGYWDRE